MVFQGLALNVLKTHFTPIRSVDWLSKQNDSLLLKLDYASFSHWQLGILIHGLRKMSDLEG